jgi:hypothetical protein
MPAPLPALATLILNEIIEKSQSFFALNLPAGDTKKPIAIQYIMKQPTDQEERNEDKKKPEKENPSHGIDPDPEEPEMEAD